MDGPLVVFVAQPYDWCVLLRPSVCQLDTSTAIDAIRHAYLAQSQGHTAAPEPSVAKKLDEIAAAQRKTETALAMFSSSRPPEQPRNAVRFISFAAK